jgi:hypothetical protein
VPGFQAKKSTVGQILKGLATEEVGIFCGPLGYFLVVWYIFPPFGMLYQEKSGNPGRDDKSCVESSLEVSGWPDPG